MDTLYIGFLLLNFLGTKEILVEDLTLNLVPYRTVMFIENDCQHGSKTTLEFHFGQIF